jgi:hypothetical protein
MCFDVARGPPDWLLENAPGEVLVLRPEPAKAPRPSAAAT